MTDYNPLMIKIWTGELKPVKKITLFAEKDIKDELFYKIEGQNNTDYFMIHYYYDREEAKKLYLELLDELVDSQVKNLSNL